MDRDRLPERTTNPPHAPLVVQSLIALNVGVWFLQFTLTSAADVRGLLGFAPSDLDAWWTVLTYQFVHVSVWPLAINMYALWLFGSRLESRWGGARFASFFALCGVGGWLVQLLFIRDGVLMGSAGAVMAVMLAYASVWRSEPVALLGAIPVSARVLASVFVLAQLGMELTHISGSGVSSLAHVGALAAGWAYLRMAASMDIDRLRRHVAAVADEPEDVPPRAIPPRTGPRQRAERDARDVDDIVQQSQAAIAERNADAPARDASSVATARASSAELNALLDKISAHGLDGLTQGERDQLEDAARRLRGA